MLDKAHGWFRRWFAKVWRIRGGGLYACGFAATFIYLEVSTIASEFVGSSSISAFFSEQLIEFVFRFAIDSIVNTVRALMWPVYFVQWQPPLGAIGLGLAFFAFPKYLKPPITKWLFPDGEKEAAE